MFRFVWQLLPGAEARLLLILVFCSLFAGTRSFAAAPDYLAQRGSQFLGQQFEQADGERVEVGDVVLRSRTGEIVQVVSAAGEPLDPRVLGWSGAGAHAGREDMHRGRARHMQLGELLDAQLENRYGDRIGAVEEVVLDLAGRRVDYLVVRFDERWLGSAKRVAVPLRALVARSAEDRGWVFDTDTARAISLPAFEPEHLRSLNDDEVVEEVHGMLERSPWLRTSHSGLDLPRE